MTETPTPETPESSSSDTPTPASPPSEPSSNNTIMCILSYLWLLALVPLLAETNDSEVQWHAKHGIVLMVGEIVLWIALTILSQIPGIGVIFGCGLAPLIWLLILVIHIIAIVKAVKGERLMIPVITEYANRWHEG